MVIGSFFDLPIAQTLYAKDNAAAMAISFMGFVLFFGMCTFYLGVLAKIKSLIR